MYVETFLVSNFSLRKRPLLPVSAVKKIFTAETGSNMSLRSVVLFFT